MERLGFLSRYAGYQKRKIRFKILAFCRNRDTELAAVEKEAEIELPTLACYWIGIRAAVEKLNFEFLKLTKALHLERKIVVLADVILDCRPFNRVWL